MTKHNSKESSLSYQILQDSCKSPYFLSGVLFALFVWVLDPFIDSVFLHQGTIYQQTFNPSSAQIYMRSVLSSVIITLSFIYSFIITQRKRTEKALEERAQYFRLFSLSTGDCFWNWDMVAGTVERSSGFERSFGYSEQEILPGIEWWAERIHPQDKERVWKEFDAAVAGDQSICSYEYRFRCRDDSYAIVEDHVCLIRNATGKVVRSLGAMLDITERKQTEKALTISEEKYFKAFRSVPDAVSISCLSSGVYKEVNDSFLKISGYSRDEVIDHSAIDLGIWVILEQREDFVKKLKEKGMIRDMEVKLRMKDDDLRDFFMSAEIIKIDDEDYILNVARDITEHKQAQEKLSASERRFRGVFENSPMGMVMVNKDGKILTINRAISDMSGYMEEEIIGKTYSDLTHPDDLEVSIQNFQKLASGEIDNYRLEKRYLHKDGHTVYSILYGYLVCDEQNNPQYMVAHIEDITKQKRAKDKLRESEERYRALTEVTTAIIWSTDESGSFVVPQPSWEKFTGQPWSESKGFGWTKKIHPDDIEHILATWEKSRREKSIHKESGRIWSANFKDWRDFEVRAVPLINADGSLREWAGVITDITERKQAEKKLRKLANKMQLVREEERAAMSREIHDQLGQTLAFLKIDLSWILEHLSPKQKDIKERVLGDIVLMDQTLQAVRRISHNLRPIILDELGLEAAIEYQVEEFNQRMGKTCPCELELNAKKIGLDNKRDTAVFRVLQEALINVAQHAQANLVKVTLSTLESLLLLCVEDNGIGLDLTGKKDTFGIIGMYERCHAIGGEFQIEVVDGGGTRIICSVPLGVTA